MCIQPNSSELARRRAFCFKTSYINKIYKVLCDEKLNRPFQNNRILTDKTQTIEEFVISKFTPYFGKTVLDLCNLLNCNYKSKSVNANIARKIIGFDKKNKSFYEFDAAGIQIKTIRVETNGKIRESMSFKNIYYNEIIYENWEDSTFYEELVSKFIFIIFRKTEDEKSYYLEKVKFWNMPQKDIDEAKLVWEKTKDNIINGDFDNFPKLKDNRVSHVRPKGKNSSDLIETEGFGLQKKYCFWLNKDYIELQI